MAMWRWCREECVGAGWGVEMDFFMAAMEGRCPATLQAAMLHG
jgi:hypothetical protein